MRLLLVEDDPMIGEAVLDALRAEHYAVDWVRDGAMAETALATGSYDLVLLDLGLPRRDGLDVLRGMRVRRSRRCRCSWPPRVTRSATASPAWTPAPTTTWSSPTTRSSCSRASAPCCGAAPGTANRCTATGA